MRQVPAASAIRQPSLESAAYSRRSARRASSGSPSCNRRPAATVTIRESIRMAPKLHGCRRNCEMYGPTVQPGYVSRNKVFVVTAPPTFGPRKSDSFDKSAAAACASRVRIVIREVRIAQQRHPVQLRHLTRFLRAGERRSRSKVSADASPSLRDRRHTRNLG